MTETSSILGAAGSIGRAHLNYQPAVKVVAAMVTPPLVDYSEESQSSAARELEATGAPCPRDFVVDNCSVTARMIIDYGDLRKKYGPQKKMSDAYDWAADASPCYDLAIKTLRERYLPESLPGETAAQWLAWEKSQQN